MSFRKTGHRGEERTSPSSHGPWNQMLFRLSTRNGAVHLLLTALVLLHQVVVQKTTGEAARGEGEPRRHRIRGVAFGADEDAAELKVRFGRRVQIRRQRRERTLVRTASEMVPSPRRMRTRMSSGRALRRSSPEDEGFRRLAATSPPICAIAEFCSPGASPARRAPSRRVREQPFGIGDHGVVGDEVGLERRVPGRTDGGDPGRVVLEEDRATTSVGSFLNCDVVPSKKKSDKASCSGHQSCESCGQWISHIHRYGCTKHWKKKMKLRDQAVHIQLQRDLIEHNWMRYGSI
ncbi:hypothetical protein EJB05_13900, partial [Eragrostis curvula]